MKRYILPAAFLLTFYWPMSCTNNESATTTTDSSAIGTTVATTETTTTTGSHALLETETYTDLKTGKTFRLKRDNSGNYASESGEPLNYYFSSSTHDTFYGPSGRWVNNALVYDANNGYSIDESRATQTNTTSSGDMGTPDKVKSTESEFKAKSNDGSDKVKVTNDEAKMKASDGSKIKTNGNETKIKNK
jgi:hypothetical protein